MSRPQLIILTGFLGAGKTTILNRLLGAEEGSETGVVINEAGTEVDNLLLEAGEGAITVLPNGCLCCRSRGDLSPALAQLLRERSCQDLRQFKRIVVETSGLADPAPILEEIASSPFCNRALSFAGLVTVADARALEMSCADHPQASLQIAFADRLLITKTDLVSDLELEGVQRTLAALNPEAPQIVVPYAKFFDRSIWPEALGLLDHAQRKMPSRPACPETGPHIAVASLTFGGSLDEDALEEWLDHTLTLFGPSLLRLKAILDLNGSTVPIAVHAVQGAVHAPSLLAGWPAQGRHNRAVLIGKSGGDLLEDALARLRSLAAPRPSDKREPQKTGLENPARRILQG
jgi:G3E family GTPase